MNKINIEEFEKVEIRIGTVLEAIKVPEADRLIKLVFDFGDEHRQIMSAIAEYYPDPSVLVDKQIAVCVNLEPRKFRGYESQGMILATHEEDGRVVLLIPEKPVKAGSKIY